MEQKPVRTKGNVIVNELKAGDVLYEFEYGFCIKTTVKEAPVRVPGSEEDNDTDEGMWQWTGVKDDGTEISYSVGEKYPHYGPNLYNYEAYMGCKMI